MYTYGDSVAKPCPTLATLVACQAPLSMEFPREGYWNGLPFPSPRYPPDPGIELASSALQEDSLLLIYQGSPYIFVCTYNYIYICKWASLVAQLIKNLPAMWRPGFESWVGKIPWRRKWQSIPVFLPQESHGQRSLAGYSPWGHKSRAQLSD